MELPIDYVGVIFYEKSKRYVEKESPSIEFQGKKKVGVFVNASLEFIIEKGNDFDFQTIQLHGKESPEFCKKMKELV